MRTIRLLFLGLLGAASSVLPGCSLGAARHTPQDFAPPPSPAPSVGVGTQPGERLPAFQAEAIAFDGETQRSIRIDTGRPARVTVYMFLGTTCGATSRYAGRVLELERSYRARGVEFVYLYPNRNDTGEAKLAYHRRQGFAGAMIDDAGAQIARLLDGRCTSEAYVCDRSGTILYRGGIDDNVNRPAEVTARYLAQALDEHLGGKRVSVPIARTQA